jgi:hypothetical protein
MNLIHVLSSQPWVERLGWTLVHFLWRVYRLQFCMRLHAE